MSESFGSDEEKTGIYAKYMSREYKEAWNKLAAKHNGGIVMFKNLDDESEENETKTKL